MMRTLHTVTLLTLFFGGLLNIQQSYAQLLKECVGSIVDFSSETDWASNPDACPHINVGDQVRVKISDDPQFRYKISIISSYASGVVQQDRFYTNKELSVDDGRTYSADNLILQSGRVQINDFHVSENSCSGTVLHRMNVVTQPFVMQYKWDIIPRDLNK